MKNKKTNQGKELTMLLLLVTVIVTMGVMIGCGKEVKTPDSENDTTEVVDVTEDTEEPEASEVPEVTEEPENTEEPEDTEEPEVTEEPEEPSVDLTGYEDIDNEELAIWMATTEAPTFGVYIWDAETATAIEVVNAEHYTVTEMDQLVVRCDEMYYPSMYGIHAEYASTLEYYAFKLDNINYEVYVYIQMTELDENLQPVYMDYIVEFYVEP